ncbi:MAG: hypothetical protein P4L28_02145 [Paludibacteraceae bacterium]|nr:hypothetical protein [Paludibacteraceae bacterium]
MILTEKLHKIILLFIFSLLSFVAFSQTSVLDKKISIQFSHKPLGFVLKSIEKQADVNFVYVSGLFNPNRLVSISVKNTSLRIITRKLIQDKTIEFQARGKNIVLSKKEKMSGDKDIAADKTPITKKLQRVDALKESDVMKIPVVLPPPVITKDTLAVIKQDTVVNPILEKEQDDANAISIKNTTRTPSIREWHIGVYGGYNFLSEELSQNKAQYVLFKEVKDAEAIKSVFSGGISLEYKKGNWGLQTGLGITSKKWSVKYNYRVIKPNLAEIVGYNESTSWVTDETGIDPGDDDSPDNTIVTRTPIYKNDTVNVNYSNVNTASYLVVPLQLNHYYPISTHFGIQLGFGTELMLLYSSQGMIKVSKNSELEDIDKYLNDCYFRLKVLLGLNYFLTERNILSLQTSYGFNATSVFKAAYPIDRFETAVSITLSYAWRF